MGPLQNLTPADQLSANLTPSLTRKFGPWVLKAAVRVQVGVQRDSRGTEESWQVIGEQCSIATMASTDPQGIRCRRLCDGNVLKANRFRDIRVYASIVMLALNDH
eukprot:scaffold648529_cov41-Prasinocladus_malaysianus.AAC.1